MKSIAIHLVCYGAVYFAITQFKPDLWIVFLAGLLTELGIKASKSRGWWN